MCTMQQLFYNRYHILSAVDRRLGGQGLVQFAGIISSQHRVRWQCFVLCLIMHVMSLLPVMGCRVMMVGHVHCQRQPDWC